MQAALRWARSGPTAARFRVDTARVVLVGHSMGGWLALMTAAADPRVVCVAGLDSRNTGAYARMLQGNRTADSAVVLATDSLTAPGAPYRVDGSGAALVTEMKANADRWDLTAHARALSDRPVLLVGAALRTDHDGLVERSSGPARDASPRSPGTPTTRSPTDALHSPAPSWTGFDPRAHDADRDRSLQVAESNAFGLDSRSWGNGISRILRMRRMVPRAENSLAQEKQMHLLL